MRTVMMNRGRRVFNPWTVCQVCHAPLFQVPCFRPRVSGPVFQSRRWQGTNAGGLTVQQFHLNLPMAAVDNANLLRRAARQIDGAATDERPAIVDANGDRTAIAGVGNAHHAAKRQRLMRSGHGAHVKPLSIRGKAAVKAAPVIGRDPGAKIAEHARRFRYGFDRCIERVEVNGGVGDKRIDVPQIRGERFDDPFEISGEGDVGSAA